MEQNHNSTKAPKFFQLWPTQFMPFNLPGNDQANHILSELVLEKNANLENMTVEYISNNIFNLDHPGIKWLKQCCDRAVLDYAKKSGINYNLEWTLQGWANVNMRGDYHNLHNHPHSWLSGTYYVSVPDQAEADVFRSDLNPCAISFFDPRPQANMNSIRNDGQVDPEFRILPNNGDIFLWPAFLHHLVHPNMSDKPRISISFNVILKWKDEYIANAE